MRNLRWISDRRKAKMEDMANERSGGLQGALLGIGNPLLDCSAGALTSAERWQSGGAAVRAWRRSAQGAGCTMRRKGREHTIAEKAHDH
jgi:hypothetical protein